MSLAKVQNIMQISLKSTDLTIKSPGKIPGLMVVKCIKNLLSVAYD